MTAPAVIEVRGLTKHFGAVEALEDLDLDVEPGEIFGYLGPNGAGKTTTIRLLLDLIRPTRGSAMLFGCAPSDFAVRRRIGYMPGELRLDPRYTTSRLIAFFAELYGGVDYAYVRELYERLDLDPTRPMGELSTGNRRKVGIVQAFMHRPELLLLDEPSSGLDPLLQHEFQSLVREAVGDGATVLLSSHVLPEVEALADRVAILREGRLLTIATVDDLRRRAVQRIDLYVSGRSVAKTAFRALPEVKSVETRDGVVRLTVEGSIDRVMKTATAKLKIDRIVAPEADLDEVFLEFYAPAPENEDR